MAILTCTLGTVVSTLEARGQGRRRREEEAKAHLPAGPVSHAQPSAMSILLVRLCSDPGVRGDSSYPKREKTEAQGGDTQSVSRELESAA